MTARKPIEEKSNKEKEEEMQGKGMCIRCCDSPVTPADPNGLLCDYCLQVTERERDR